MRFLVWGAGAIGGTMAAHLARAGHDVTVVDTVDEHVAAISRAGLQITGPVSAFAGFDPAAYLPDAPPGAAARSLDDLVTFNRRSAKTHGGIWRDLAVRKRRTEVDAQLGIVATLGRDAGVPAPLTARVVELIHDVENGARPQSLDTLNVLVEARLAAAMADG